MNSILFFMINLGAMKVSDFFPYKTFSGRPLWFFFLQVIFTCSTRRILMSISVWDACTLYKMCIMPFIFRRLLRCFVYWNVGQACFIKTREEKQLFICKSICPQIPIAVDYFNVLEAEFFTRLLLYFFLFHTKT